AIGDELVDALHPRDGRLRPFRFGQVDAARALGRLDPPTVVADPLGDRRADAAARAGDEGAPNGHVPGTVPWTWPNRPRPRPERRSDGGLRAVVVSSGHV